jgi:hypothetical protein
MTTDVTSPQQATEPRKLLAYLLLVPVIAVFVVAAVVIYGSIGGGTYVHAGSATNAALFSGKAVGASEAAAAKAFAACGVSTSTVKSVTYSTSPFIVDGVTLGKAPASAYGMSGKGTLGSCLISAFAAEGAAAQLCTFQSASSAGASPADIGPRLESLVICVSESGQS